ncbi:MAG: alanine racemase [Pseudomonadota bacterium]
MSSLAARLTVDLDAIVANWRALDAKTALNCTTGAVVKADAYGCGTAKVGRALADAGVNTFFVAMPAEGATLREAIGPGPLIYILGGYGRDQQGLYSAHALRPCLNSAQQYRDWHLDMTAPAGIQIDTGMNRLGMEAEELADLGPLSPQIDMIMSHMGNADDPDHPLNAQQNTEFRRMTSGLSGQHSLSATAGLLLGPDYHFDLTRMGIGLYGGWPFEDARTVVTVEAPIIQVRELTPQETVGYGATFTAQRPTRIATISAGYADGLIRAMSNGATAYLNGHPVPLAGRVSMDLITLDVTDAPPCAPGDFVELLGPNQSIDDMAKAAGTIGHEILTSLGSRYARHYDGM